MTSGALPEDAGLEITNGDSRFYHRPAERHSGPRSKCCGCQDKWLSASLQALIYTFLQVFPASVIFISNGLIQNMNCLILGADRAEMIMTYPHHLLF